MHDPVVTEISGVWQLVVTLIIVHLLPSILLIRTAVALKSEADSGSRIALVVIIVWASLIKHVQCVGRDSHLKYTEELLYWCSKGSRHEDSRCSSSFEIRELIVLWKHIVTSRTQNILPFIEHWINNHCVCNVQQELSKMSVCQTLCRSWLSSTCHSFWRIPSFEMSRWMVLNKQRPLKFQSNLIGLNLTFQQDFFLWIKLCNLFLKDV